MNAPCIPSQGSPSGSLRSMPPVWSSCRAGPWSVCGLPVAWYFAPQPNPSPASTCRSAPIPPCWGQPWTWGQRRWEVTYWCHWRWSGWSGGYWCPAEHPGGRKQNKNRNNIFLSIFLHIHAWCNSGMCNRLTLNLCYLWIRVLSIQMTQLLSVELDSHTPYVCNIFKTGSYIALCNWFAFAMYATNLQYSVLMYWYVSDYVSYSAL